MRFSRANAIQSTPCVAAAIVALVCAAPLPAHAQDKSPYVMKITAPTLNAAPDLFGRAFGAAVEKESGGRIKAEVYPASQLGAVPRQIEGTQFGSIQCAMLPPEFFVGVDQRFEVLAAPGLVDSGPLGERLAADPAVQKLMLGLGADKGLRGVGVFYAEPAYVATRAPIRHLPDFNGKKIRIFASDFQRVAFQRLGASPIAMSPSDVLVAIQQGTLDGATAGITFLAGLKFQGAAKYVTQTDHSSIFIMAECSKKWLDTLPEDLRQVIDRVGASEAKAYVQPARDIIDKGLKGWTEGGGELIELPANERAEMIKTLASVGADVAKSKPQVQEAYKLVTDAVARLRK
jgi:TRAP-type C4-dicarboxylate transport system substrate-binding protein